MKKLFFIIIIILSFSFHACKNASANTGTTDEIELISPQQVYDAVHSNETVQLIDVRTKEEFIKSHLKGAQNICLTDKNFNEKVKALDKNKPVYVYCKKGVRSANAAKELKKMGFSKIYDMEGGIILWEDEDLETEK